MARKLDLVINWRAEFAALAPFFTGQGGVIHIVASDEAPISTFAKVIRTGRIATDGADLLSVQFDNDNPNTHYFEDIIVQFERSLGIDGQLPQDYSGRIVVASDIDAQNVTVSDVTINADPDSFADLDNVVQRCDRLGATIRARLEQQRICLIFLNSHEYGKRTLTRLRTLLWDPLLDELTAAGLVVVDIGDPSRHPTDAWPPDADLVLELPEAFTGDARVHAEEDLAAIAVREGATATEPDGRVFAQTQLAAFPTIRGLYAQLGGTLRRMAAQADPK